jgi:hypothetical protein
MSEPQSPRQAILLAALAGALVVVGLLSYLLFFRATTAARVTGRVTLDDEPVPGAQVAFFADDEAAPAPVVGSSDDGGTYRLLDNSPAGIRTGHYRVVVIREAAKQGTTPTGDALERARSNDLLQNVLPAIYADRKTTPLTADLRAGANTVDLRLKKRP